MITTRARAYINHGRWVADCPTGCGSARALSKGETAFHCSECLTISEVEWPDNSSEIWEALLMRRFPKNRNWFPKDHEFALRAHLPHGQTVKDLVDEMHENGGA